MFPSPNLSLHQQGSTIVTGGRGPKSCKTQKPSEEKYQGKTLKQVRRQKPGH